MIKVQHYIFFFSPSRTSKCWIFPKKFLLQGKKNPMLSNEWTHFCHCGQIAGGSLRHRCGRYRWLLGLKRPAWGSFAESTRWRAYFGNGLSRQWGNKTWTGCKCIHRMQLLFKCSRFRTHHSQWSGGWVGRGFGDREGNGEVTEPMYTRWNCGTQRLCVWQIKGAIKRPSTQRIYLPYIEYCACFGYAAYQKEEKKLKKIKIKT